MPEPLIQVNDVFKAYGSRQALQGVSLEVHAGEIVALLGPNGGGKTTLFRILATLLDADRGTVRVGGFDPAATPAQVRRHIGVVFQSPSLDKKLTVTENLKHHGHLYGLRGAELQRRIDALLDSTGLADRTGDLVETLSGGLARRVEIAKGILPDPRVLLLDEPSTGLDPAARRDLWFLLDDLRQRKGVSALLTTHILDEAQRCDRVIVLDAGKVAAEGTPAELKRQVGGEVINIEGDDPKAIAERIRAEFDLQPSIVDGRVHFETDNGAALIPRIAAALEGRVSTITLAKPTLEDAFIHITGHAFTKESPS